MLENVPSRAELNSRMEDSDHGGEEDLSYVSGDERDFNESVQEQRLVPNELKRNLKYSNPVKTRIE